MSEQDEQPIVEGAPEQPQPGNPNPEPKKEFSDAEIALYARLKKAEEKLAKYMAKDPEPKTNFDDEYRQKVDSLSEAEHKRQVGYKFGLSPDETDQLFVVAKGKGMKPQEAVEDPWFKAGLEAVRSQKKAEAGTPRSTNAAPKIDGKTFAEMSPEERKANWGAMTQAVRKK